MQNAKKRILCVVTQAEWGGVQSYLVRFGSEAIKRDYDVLIVAGGEGLLEHHCHEKGVPYRRLLKMEREISPLNDIGAIRELVNLIREWKPDTLYLHSSKTGVIGSIAGRITGIKHIIYRIGGWSFLDPVSTIQKQIRIWSERLTAPLKDVIITLHPEDFARADKYHIVPKKGVVMIPNAINVETFDAIALPYEEARHELEALWQKGIHKTNLNRTSSTPLLLTVANFYATKDLIRYMETIAIVTKTYPNIQVLIVGEGQLRSEIESKRKELNLESIVSLPGANDHIQRSMNGADLFILPSAKEGMPWTLLEAMTAKIPCIATDVGACEWILKESGQIVPPKQPDALAQAIIDALNHPEKMKEMAEHGRKAIEKRFVEQIMWEKTFEVIEG